MTPIGGFFGLEREGTGGAPWHGAATALTSGRACLAAVLRLTRPPRVFVPFYICDAALAPFAQLGIPVEFYELTRALDPVRTAWPADAAVLFVNYFDLKSCGADAIAASLGGRAVIDDTQAFFRQGHAPAWAFNSARKFFGVPDGAYLYGPRAGEIQPSAPNDAAPAAHLTTKISGDPQLAYRQYVDAEEHVSSEPLAPSPLTTRMLAAVAYDDVRAARRRNFAALHQRLGASNTIEVPLSLDADAAPFCYPFLPARLTDHEALWKRDLFVPRLWPEVASRRASGFEWERDLAARLLPLPVDHRYGVDDMARVSDVVLEAAA